jgi:hypothetical protein
MTLYDAIVIEDDAPADERVWMIRAENGALIVEAWNDARTAYDAIKIERIRARILNEPR